MRKWFATAVVSAALTCAALAGCALSPGTPGTQPAPSVTPTASFEATAPSSQLPTAETTPSAPATPSTPTTPTFSASTFAVIGDYGTGDAHEAAVARLVARWRPLFILALGDDYYAQAGGTGTGRYDRSTGRFYSAWLKDVTTTGTHRGTAPTNRFFPALGNHDYSDARPSPGTYLTYFRLPGAGYASSSGNERYYDVVVGRTHVFVLNSNPDEPDGITATSRQAVWLRKRLAASRSRFNVVIDHHPPYSSDSVHGSTTALQWPFAAWGADVVLSGHAHVYERIERNGITYLVNGLGGAKRYGFRGAVKGSVRRYDADWGALKVTVTNTALVFEFYSESGQRIDRVSVTPK